MSVLRRPTLDELAHLRATCPQGAPHITYREMTLDVRAEMTLDVRALEEGEGDQRVGIAISSEAPVRRFDWWSEEEYDEVLDHAPESVLLDYARDGLPFVMSHRARDGNAQHGLVEEITVDDDRVMRGRVRFSRAVRSQEIRADLIDGIRKKVSVGYVVGDDYVQTAGKGANAVPTRRYKAWMPIEVSTVPIPADYSVGVDRAQSPEGQAALSRFLTLHPARERKASHSAQDVIMPPGSPPSAETHAPPIVPPTPSVAAAAPGPDAAEIRVKMSQAAADQIRQVREIAALAQQPDVAEDWLRAGLTPEQALAEGRKLQDARAKQPPVTSFAPDIPARERRRFNFTRAMLIGTEIGRDFETGPSGPNGKPDFGYEREIVQAYAAHRMSREGGFIPFDVTPHQRSGLDSTTSTTGGSFKYTQPGEFIDLLRNTTSVMRAGARVFTGLQGSLALPKQTSSVTAAWTPENQGSDITVTQLGTGLLTLAHKSVGALTGYSRQMLFAAASGNIAIDALVQDDLTKTLALAVDKAALAGSGSNQPSGLLSNTDIGSVTLGTSGGTIAWSNLVALETKVAQSNGATGSLAYLTNGGQRGVAKNKAQLGSTLADTPMWGGAPNPEFDGTVNGYRAFVSEQVPSNLTKGTATTICSAWVFGNFAELIVAFWGPGIEVITDQYTSMGSAFIRVGAWAYMDAGVRQAGAFAAIKDAL